MVENDPSGATRHLPCCTGEAFLPLRKIVSIGDPAADNGFGIGGCALFQQGMGMFTGLLQQCLVAGEVGDAVLQDAGLPGTEHFAGAAQLQVGFGDNEAVVALAQDVEPVPRLCRQG